MESGSASVAHDTHDGSTKKPVEVEKVLAGDRKHHSSIDTIQGNKVDTRESEYRTAVGSGDVNMEASISADDVMRAGGYGARDDISSFLPVASDSTDFEATLRDARDYEEPQKDISRPGLGWKDQEKP